MYSEIEHVMKAADVVKNNGGYGKRYIVYFLLIAIIYEAIKTVVTIFPNKKMLDFASTYVSSLMQIPNPNIRYLGNLPALVVIYVGLKSLANIIQFNSDYAVEHQMTIIDCLEHKDEIIRRRVSTHQRIVLTT